MRNWKIIDRGKVPEPPTDTIGYACRGCGQSALLPVLGVPIAETDDGGVIFDDANYALPKRIACPHCRRNFEAGK